MMKIVSLALGLLFLANGCGGGNNESDFSENDLAYDTEEIYEEDNIVTKQLTPPAPPQQDDTEIQEKKVIKTAHLTFETQDLEAAYKNAIATAKKFNGNVLNDNSGKDYRRLFRNLTLRIPSENFEEAMINLSEGVVYFDRREISQQDVTEEFVDINARLKAKRELENRYLELLKQAKNVEDLLKIERELSNIREEIEAREGRLKYLSSQVSMSTIYLEFYRTTAETGVTVSYGQKIKNALNGGWDGISVFFLGILYLWPFLILMLIFLFIIRIYLRRKKK